jgi:hypothetical protein
MLKTKEYSCVPEADYDNYTRKSQVALSHGAIGSLSILALKVPKESLEKLPEPS